MFSKKLKTIQKPQQQREATDEAILFVVLMIL